jgi:hypothetical protein
MNQNFIKVNCWTAIISLFALVAGCSAPNPTQGASPSKEASSPASNAPTPNSKPSKLSLPKTTRKVGEVVPIKDKNLDMTLTVNGTREHQGKRVLKPNKGNKWVLVNTTIVNQGQKPSILPVVAFQLIDSANNQYEVSLLAGALEDVKTPTGQINPGAEQQGEVAFEVPEKAKGLKLFFSPNSTECNASNAPKSKASSTLNCEPIVVNLEQ